MKKQDYVRSHFTKSEDLVVQNKHYKQNWFKPIGFWYEIDNSWEEWVSGEMPHWFKERYHHKFKVEIDLSNVLVIDTPDKFEAFHEKYSGLERPQDNYMTINWNKVAKDYDGIEITHYLHQFRMERKYQWYYPWDVASGCIWRNHKCITVKERMERTVPVYNYDED